MSDLTLERVETSDHGTFGRVVVDGRVLFTGELPDRGNAPNISCVPAGTYGCEWTWSPAFKRFMYLLGPTPGRSGIRIHPANLCGDRACGLKAHLNGCIALGERLGTMDGQKALIVSAPAVRRLESAMERKSFILEIQPCSDS